MTAMTALNPTTNDQPDHSDPKFPYSDLERTLKLDLALTCTVKRARSHYRDESSKHACGTGRGLKMKGWSSSIGDMKSKLPQNLISTFCNSSDYRENAVEDAEGKKFRHEVLAPAGPSKTDLLLTIGQSRKQIYLDGDLAKREYEDMTSCRIEDVDAGNDHEVSTTLRFFRDHKKRRPPEAGKFMLQVQETNAVRVERARVEDEALQGWTPDSTRRSRSASRVEITPEICGESDLTAEHHMAEESSRSSNNNDASSMFESAAESVSKGSSRRELRSVSSLGVMHCFLNHVNGDRDVSVPPSSGGGPRQMSRPFAKNDYGHDIDRTAMKDAKDRDPGVPKSEPAANHQLGSGSTETPSSVTASTVPSQLWGSSNQEWLQLGLGASSNFHPPEPASTGEEGNPLSQDHEELASFMRKITTPIIDCPIAADFEANSSIFAENSNVTAPGEWQVRSLGSNVMMPPKCEGSSEPLVHLNPATFGSVPISSVMRNASEGVDHIAGQPDLCIFGRKLIQTGTARQELVLAPFSCSGTRQSSSNPSESKERGMASIDKSFELRRDQEDFQGFMFPAHRRDERLDINATMRVSEIHNRAGPSLISSMSTTPITDAHLRSAQAPGAGTSIMDNDTIQSHLDNPLSSLSALQQRREDLRHGQVEYSWLPPPAADLAPKLIPTANNFQGWTSSESVSSTKLAALSGNNNAPSDMPLEQQAMRDVDEWGNLFRKVGPKMLFQSQCHLPEGSSVLVQSAGHESNVGSQENLVALKRAIDNIQKRPPSWPTPPDAMNFSVASWCLNGTSQGIRGDPNLECFSGERPLMSSILPESVPVHSRFAGGDHLSLSEKPLQQRQSWQPVAGHPKLHHGNVNALQRPSETAQKPKFQLLPPGSRGSNHSHAGLWFILQSAEHQNGEGGLPQISKAYLRIKDGKMPVSAVKKYLVSKLGLTSESEVEITCKGQPVVPSLPLQHVRDVIWFSSLDANNNNKEPTSSGEREESTTSASDGQRSRPPASTTDRAATAAGMFSKDILMVLTYRRHPRTLQLSPLLK